MMGLSVWKLLIIALLVMMLFGTSRLRSIGSDLGGALSGFRRSMREEPVDGDEPRRELK
ncbi:TatA protein [Ectopseudomonas mendocina]|uniref:Sec-independent protein translocase protein TatA n=2 Tax=Ectopseudomonas mendocina TaxID=300 RepID=A0A379IMK9_ECTME|nr:twin-arginine translocase TatA/TatE family subunit [Pseudomonas mendocina]AEB56175.1 TatA [Pseudomonas mendocina NK-01]ALN21397.1 preprotein translocase subunit TatA [Pseudomonas mendocina S5.2]KES02286.1 preprotein translocase subunit TatA [Pseudomonas mendocina]MDF2076547.1 twin-arginine translocase TatA/TatE family subunit [Pseudomonas mendocina]QTN48041.1 twin-arginine translocase TatA/TatE family subunit [Pseudomonas mendocina]